MSWVLTTDIEGGSEVMRLIRNPWHCLSRHGQPVLSNMVACRHVELSIEGQLAPP